MYDNQPRPRAGNDQRSLRLPDGRSLGYIDRGENGAPPLFFFHGSGSTATGLRLGERLRARGARLISPARPGIGGSDPNPSRTLAQWSDDVAALAEHLAIERFAVLGFSGGAPYALAVASGLPLRVSAAAIISCGGPFEIDGASRGMARSNRLLWSLVRYRPGVVRFLFSQQAKQLTGDPGSPTVNAVRALKGPDRAAVARLDEEERHRFFDGPMAEALRHGPDGLVQDMVVLRRPWDFDPGRIEVPVRLWHGTMDTSAPMAMARHLANTIPDCTATMVDGGGHLSTILDHIDDAVNWALSAH